MKRQVVICDRCGRETKEGRIIVVGLNERLQFFVENNKFPNENLDLCPRCFGDFRHFLRRRTLADVGRELFG